MQTATSTTNPVHSIINFSQHAINSDNYRKACKKKLDETGALVLENFLEPQAIDAIRLEGDDHQHLAYFTSSSHNVYLRPSDTNYSDDHPRNRQVTSSKGCITTDQIPVGPA